MRFIGVEALWSGTVTAENDVTGPMTLSKTGEYYRLTQDIVANGTAFTITANDIILDFNGHRITYDNDSTSSNHHGIDIDASGVTIKNGTIIQGSGKSRSLCAINLRKGIDHEIHSMVIKTHGEESQGILGSCSGSSIHHCFIDCQSNTDRTDAQGAENIKISALDGGMNIYDNILVSRHRGINCSYWGINSDNPPQSNVYNNLIQHTWREGSKSAYGMATGKGRDIRFYGDQVVSDNRQGLILDGLGQGAAKGAVNNQVFDNKFDVAYSTVAIGGGYPENNVYGIRCRYSSYNNLFTNNTVIVDNDVFGFLRAFYVASDLTDPLMYDILIQNNAVIARDPGEESRDTIVFAWDYAHEITCSDNDYYTDGEVQKHVYGSSVTNLTFICNSEMTPSSYTPAAPTGLYLTKFLDSYLLRWDDSITVHAKAQTYEYEVYRDGEAIRYDSQRRHFLCRC